MTTADGISVCAQGGCSCPVSHTESNAIYLRGRLYCSRACAEDRPDGHDTSTSALRSRVRAVSPRCGRWWSRIRRTRCGFETGPRFSPPAQ